MTKQQIKYFDGYKYQLAVDYTLLVPVDSEAIVNTQFVTLTPYGELTIRAGYAWDGPSGPTIDTRSGMRGSLVHDALYQLMREEKIGTHNRPLADELLCKLCIEDGMWKWRAWLWRREVKKFAGFAAMAENNKQIITAP